LTKLSIKSEIASDTPNKYEKVSAKKMTNNIVSTNKKEPNQVNNRDKKQNLESDPYGHNYVKDLIECVNFNKPNFNSPIASRVIPLDGVDSTNEYFNKFPYLPSGSIVVARRQSEGKGQRLRKWVSNTGGLYASFKLVFVENNNIQIKNIFWIQAALGVSASHALEELGLKPIIKWPNDILLSNKKVSGILGESTTGNQGFVVILGIGMNVDNDLTEILNLFPELNEKITTIHNELIIQGIESSHKDLRINLFEKILRNLDYFWSNNFSLDLIKSDWLKYSDVINKKIRYLDSENKKHEAKVHDISEFGSLIVIEANGEQKELVVGDIELIKE
ncbi:MAG: biotin--[acetyl-CoA-carboxylase] ligase, partial [Candidatus Thorarchaeota archaeon]